MWRMQALRDRAKESVAAGSPVKSKSSKVAASAFIGVVMLLAVGAAQSGLSRDALWDVVHDVCVPGESQRDNPAPCVQVDLTGGIDKGFAIVKDPRSTTHFLLVPTMRISGIESPIVRNRNATNYFAKAWEARTYVTQALHMTLPPEDIGMAINSAASRSQDQFHIHIDCVGADVREALIQQKALIGSRWAPLNVRLEGHRYMAMRATGDLPNPFELLADELPGAAHDMGNRTLVVVGATGPDGKRGFVILADQVNNDDWANGEELLDHACRNRIPANTVPVN
jgi:CDP-diacylglycerol pyrophosphatase